MYDSKRENRANPKTNVIGQLMANENKLASPYRSFDLDELT